MRHMVNSTLLIIIRTNISKKHNKTETNSILESKYTLHHLFRTTGVKPNHHATRA